jgi:hypothetical protein
MRSYVGKEYINRVILFYYDLKLLFFQKLVKKLHFY